MTDLEKSNQPLDKTSEILAKTYSSLVEGMTGIASSDRSSLYLSLGKILQRVRGGGFLSQLQTEWDEYRQKGRIEDEYIDSDQHQECLQDVLDFLDGESPDRIRFEALKRVFLNAASANEVDSVLPQQYIRTLTKLSSGEAILLFATYQDAVKGNDLPSDASSWINRLAEESPLQFPELVELYEEELMVKMLLTKRKHSDRSGVLKGHKGYRLTSFGYHLCEFLEADSLDLGRVQNDA